MALSHGAIVPIAAATLIAAMLLTLAWSGRSPTLALIAMSAAGYWLLAWRRNEFINQRIFEYEID